MQDEKIEQMFRPVNSDENYSFQADYTEGKDRHESFKGTLTTMPANVPLPLRMRAADLIDFAFAQKMNCISGWCPMDSYQTAVKSVHGNRWECTTTKIVIA
jgi:hypothetical protein